MAKLTALKVTKLKQPGRYGDGDGLYLQISKWKTKAWVFRFNRHGRERQLGLGPLNTISLAEARDRARKARQLLLDGIDPIDERASKRSADRLDRAKATTFRQCTDGFLAAHESGWKNPKHRAQWESSIERYVHPTIGSLPVAAVDTALVLKVLEPIWAEKPETANRIRGRIERVIDWATARELRKGDNPARWRGHLDKLLSSRPRSRQVRHHPALPYDQLPQFMVELRKRKSVSASALEFTILCATRTSETIGAQWPEIDLARKVWIVPGARTKSGREHRVPLSDRALKILKGLPREKGSDFVFIGGRDESGLSNMAMLELLKGMRPGLTVHGFRSTFRDWAAEKTSHPSEVVEMALAHVIEDKVEAAYRRGDLFEKRRKLMRDWARFAESRRR